MVSSKMSSTKDVSKRWKATWTKISPKPDASNTSPSARSSHGVSVVQNGSRLIVYGGEHVARTPVGPQTACWAVDDIKEHPLVCSWRHIDCSRGPSERIAHSQAVYNDEHLFVFGGRASVSMDEKALNDLWMLDCSGEPGTETWTQITPDTEKGEGPPEARSFHQMICIGSNLYVFGGCGDKHGRLNDLWKFDIIQKTWQCLVPSSLRGRGGPSLLPACSGKKLAVIAGFAGTETNDGHIFDLSTMEWEKDLLIKELKDMCPRSVSVSGSFPSLGISILVGGEVSPSDRGHEGSGCFENDVVILDETTGAYQGSLVAAEKDSEWLGHRGWAGAGAVDSGDGHGRLYVFGGLAGDDENPVRLDDLWKLELERV